MIKYKYKKILIIFLLIMMFFIIIANRNYCFAISDVTEDITWESWQPKIEDENALKDKANIIIGAIRVIGIIVSVGSLMVIGIRVIWGSAEEKANYKQQMIPWVLGATMIFGITVIPTTIYEMVQGAFNESKVTEADTGSVQYWEDYLAGYDAAIDKAYEIFNEMMPTTTVPNKQTLDEYDNKIKSMYNKTETSVAYYKGYKEGLKSMMSATTAYSTALGKEYALKDLSKVNIYYRIYTCKKIKECQDTLGHHLNQLNYWDGTSWGLDYMAYEEAIKRLEMQLDFWKKEAELNGEDTSKFEKLFPVYSQKYMEEWMKGYKKACNVGHSAYLETSTKWRMEAAWSEEFTDLQWSYRMSPALVGYEQARYDMGKSSAPESWYKGVMSAFNAIENGTVETQMQIMNNVVLSGKSYDKENFTAFNYIIANCYAEIKNNNPQLTPEVIIPE